MGKSSAHALSLPGEPTVELYALCDETGPRYIGKAKSAAARFRAHMRDACRRKAPVYDWINSLADKGKIPMLLVVATVGEGLWRDAETFLISEARSSGARLLNVAPGGDQPSCPAEVRQRNGRKLAEWVRSERERTGTDPRWSLSSRYLRAAKPVIANMEREGRHQEAEELRVRSSAFSASLRRSDG